MSEHMHQPDNKALCFTCRSLFSIWEEAVATRPYGMSMNEAIKILIDERTERGILNNREHDVLLAQLPTEGELREMYGR